MDCVRGSHHPEPQGLTAVTPDLAPAPGPPGTPGHVPQQVSVLPHQPEQPHHLALPPAPLVTGLMLDQIGNNVQSLTPNITVC